MSDTDKGSAGLGEFLFFACFAGAFFGIGIAARLPSEAPVRGISIGLAVLLTLVAVWIACGPTRGSG